MVSSVLSTYTLYSLIVLRLPVHAQCIFHELLALHRDLPHRQRPQRLQESALPSHHHSILRLRLCRHHRHHHHGHHWPLFCCGDSKAECSKGVFSNLGGERWELIFNFFGATTFFFSRLVDPAPWIQPLVDNSSGPHSCCSGMHSHIHGTVVLRCI